MNQYVPPRSDSPKPAYLSAMTSDRISKHNTNFAQPRPIGDHHHETREIMTLDDLVNSTCLLGLSYFDTDKSLMKQTQIAGVVAHIDKENGISIRLKAEASTSAIASDAEGKIFVVPPVLETWFKAPNGIYRDADGNIAIENPDYFVTWDIYKTQDDTEEGQHEWWDWVPRVAPPSVSASPDK